jgi:hypothetical protein
VLVFRDECCHGVRLFYAFLPDKCQFEARGDEDELVIVSVLVILSMMRLSVPEKRFELER